MNMTIKGSLSQRNLQSQQRGFTLIEIMVVVIIISVLSAMIAPQFFNQVDKAKIIAVESDTGKISSSLGLFRLDNYKYPTTGEGIKALVTSTGKKTWNGPYLDEMPKDPWGNEYQYQFPGTKNPNSYDLWSMGADGQPGGEGIDGDLGNWEQE